MTDPKIEAMILKNEKELEFQHQQECHQNERIATAEKIAGGEPILMEALHYMRVFITAGVLPSTALTVWSNIKYPKH